MKHAMVMELTDGKLFHAPIGDSPSKIIDLGTGTGKLSSRPCHKRDSVSITLEC